MSWYLISCFLTLLEQAWPKEAKFHLMLSTEFRVLTYGNIPGIEDQSPSDEDIENSLCSDRVYHRPFDPIKANFPYKNKCQTKRLFKKALKMREKALQIPMAEDLISA